MIALSPRMLILIGFALLMVGGTLVRIAFGWWREWYKARALLSACDQIHLLRPPVGRGASPYVKEWDQDAEKHYVKVRAFLDTGEVKQ